MASLVRLAIFDCGLIGEKHARCLAPLDGPSVVARGEPEWSRAAQVLTTRGGEHATAASGRILAGGSTSTTTPPTVRR